MRFSTARTTPSLVLTPIAVEPNYKKTQKNDFQIKTHKNYKPIKKKLHIDQHKK